MGITQEQLAARVEKTPETISNLERGSAMTGLETLEKIASALDVSLASFVDGFDHIRAPSRIRLEYENRLELLAASLSDQYLKSAISLIEVLVAKDKNS